MRTRKKPFLNSEDATRDKRNTLPWISTQIVSSRSPSMRHHVHALVGSLLPSLLLLPFLPVPFPLPAASSQPLPPCSCQVGELSRPVQGFRWPDQTLIRTHQLRHERKTEVKTTAGDGVVWSTYGETLNRLSSLTWMACATVLGLMKATGLLGKRKSVLISALLSDCQKHTALKFRQCSSTQPLC